MKRLLLLLLALAPALVSAQNETCPRVWRSGDSLMTDPAPRVQWLRDGQPIPGATTRWLTPTEAGRYSVEARSGLSVSFPVQVGLSYTLAGYVFDELHRPVAGARVKRGPFSITTDSSGRFALIIMGEKPNEETPVVVTVEKEGYWRNASRQYISAFQTTETHIMLHTQRVTNRVDATEGGEMLYRGFTLQLPPNSVQTEDGTPYSGTILLSVEGSRPSDPDFGLRMPGGDFAAIDANGNDVMLYSYGYLSAEMATESGEKLELRPDMRATLRFYLPYTEKHRPDSVPLWHFNAETAIWEQEGWSRRNGSIYEGEVSHFSSWNCDLPSDRGTVKGRVVDCNGDPIMGGSVRVGQRQVATDSLGLYRSVVPGGINFDTWASTDTLRNITVPAQEERTLEDLTGSVNFGGLALWNPQAQTLDLNLWGKVPANIRFSIDGKQTWRQERQLTKVTFAPEAVQIDGGCLEEIRVVVFRGIEDCRRISKESLDSTYVFTSIVDAMQAQSSAIKMNLQNRQFNGNWSLLNQFSCLLQLSLSSNQLTEVTDHFEYLINLEELDLSSNQIRSLPESFGHLVGLKGLTLRYNQFRGLPESFGNLSNLQSLTLDHNLFVALPQSFGSLSELRKLSLNACGPDSLPESFGNLVKLEWLLISNSMFDLPESFGNLESLQWLSLNGNQLSNLPDNFSNLSNLRTLEYRSNYLRNLPEEICNLANLQDLDLRGNELSSVPDNFSNLRNLRHLVLSYNKVTSLPQSFGNLDSLEALDLSGNPLTSTPECIFSLSVLRTLSLSNCRINTVSENIGRTTSLESLILADNRIENLPDSLCSLNKLQVLRLNNNRIANLPENIGNLLELKSLRLEQNRLSALPEGFGGLSNLRSLRIDSNQLDSLPESFGDLASLDTLWLMHNKLTRLPESFGNLSNLQFLFLDYNNLKSLPESIGGLTSLRELRLNYNQLIDLPESIANLAPNLRNLQLTGNRIPVERRAAIRSMLPNTIIIW